MLGETPRTRQARSRLQSADAGPDPSEFRPYRLFLGFTLKISFVLSHLLAFWVRLGSFWVRFLQLLLMGKDLLASFVKKHPYSSSNFRLFFA